MLSRLRRSSGQRKPWAITALLTLVLATIVVPAGPAVAAPGDAAAVYLAPSTAGATIGSNKDLVGPTECPSNSVLTGVQTENRQNVAPTSANSILVRVSIQCATLAVSNAGVISGTVNPTWITGPVWDESRGNVQTGVCPANTFVHRITGTTFVGDGGFRWPSSVQITCRPMTFDATGALRVNLAATPTVLTIGQNFNTTGGLQTPTAQCGPGGTTGTSDILVRGYRAQGGGEGFDGFTPSCATIPDDFGDAPATYGSASHELNGATYLGWSADPETAMQYSAAATGDDQVGGTAPNQFIDDENGVASFGPIMAGVTGTYSVSVLTSNKVAGVPATLVGWIDFNRNGVFDANEGASVAVPAGTADGASVTLNWTGLAARTVAGQTFARFRIASGTGLTTSTPTGVIAPGEVEDYALTITAAQPALSLVKTVTPTTVTAAGQDVTYTFAIANTGNVAVSNIGITETAFTGTGAVGPITCLATALDVGQSTTCSATYTTSQADFDAGSITNTAIATGTSAANTPVQSSPGTAVVTATRATSLTVVKSATPSGPDDFTVGQVIDYSFVVTNTGNVTVTGLAIAETAFDGSGAISAAVCPTTPLAPGGQATCTATYTLTQADIDSGSVTNTATATGVPPGSLTPPVSPPSTVTVPAESAPAITIEKTADTTEITAAGQAIAYSFLVTNTGNVTFTDVAVDDADFSGSGPLIVDCPRGAASLAPGAQVTCTADYTVTAADYTTAALTNTATATGTPPTGEPPVAPPSTVEIPVIPAPAITVAKTADVTELTAAGQTVTYSFLATNTGNVTLTDVEVAESDFTGTGTAPVIDCPDGAASLAPGASVTCEATYVVTQADLDAGGVTNTATATGTPPGDLEPPVSPPSTVELPADSTPAITVVKSADPTSIDAVGDTVAYAFLVTNTGNVTLADVAVTETAFTGTGTPLAIECPAGAASLAPGASVTCEASYTATQADVDAGQVTNTATATGTPPGGLEPPVSPPSTAIVTVPSTPGITVVKSADLTELTATGQTITYSFLATNTGNVTLTDVTVTDTDFTGTGTAPVVECPDEAASLAPDASVTCEATYVVTQADIDAGGVTNTATGTGIPPGDLEPPVSPPSTVEVPAVQTPGVTVVKSADPNTAADYDVGQEITYTFVVTNTGNVTLTDMEVTETAFTGSGPAPVIECPAEIASLAPDAQVICTAVYTLTQADVDAGQLTNTATATGTPPGDLEPPVSPPSTVEIPGDPAPALTVVKSADLTEITAAGQTIAYSFLATNSGNVTLTDVEVTEAAFTGTGSAPVIDCPDEAALLVPGASVTCEATYVVTQADIDAGGVTNTATGTGTPPTGEPPVSPPSTVEVPSTSAPAMTVVKAADLTEITAAGQTITYSFLATNTGNVTLTDVTVTETAFTGTGSAPAIECPDEAASLAPDTSITCEATYVVTQADIDAGGVTNTATGTGTPPTGEPPVSPPSTVEVPSTSAPAMTVVKSADLTEITAAGQTITYSFLATNTGNVTLADVTVTDADFTGTGTAPVIECPDEAASLAPDTSITCEATYVVTQADIDAGGVTNTATGTGTPPTGEPPVSPPSTVEVPSDAVPALTVIKSADLTELTAAGQTITYSFLATNTGNVTLTDVEVTETAFTGTGTAPVVDCPAAAASLAPDASVTCEATYVVTQADIDAGGVTNTATGTGTPPTGEPPVSPPTTVEVPSASAPALTVVKSADLTEITAAGQTVTYAFLVTNTGNVSVADVAVTETEFTGTGTAPVIECPDEAASLAPDASVTCEATYVVTQADIDAGGVTNTATATGTPPTGEPPVSPPSTVEVPATGAPAITVVKSADPTSIDAAGDTVSYGFLVTNTGNVTLTEIVVADTDFTGMGTAPVIACPDEASSLAPGASVTCEASYTATQADVDAGQVTNTATATGTPPGDLEPPVSPPSTAIVTVPSTPGITVVKSADLIEITAAGQTITYSFLATNTGNVTLTDVTVTDTDFTGSGTAPVVECPDEAASLAPDASVTCEATYVVTQADIDGGGVTNTATGTGTPPSGEPPVSPPSTVEVPATSAPALTVVKSADLTELTAAGQTITYSFLATNSGNVTLTDIVVTETDFTGTGIAPVIECPDEAASLTPGASITCEATYVVTQADIDGGGVTNTATGTGTPPTGEPPVSPPTTVEVPSTSAPAITIVKTADVVEITAAGQTVTYAFLATNTGNVTLADVAVTETAFTGTGTAPVIECPDEAASLAPEASVTCEATYVVTQADMDAGGVTNTATATGTPPTGEPPVSPPSTVEVPATATPAITVVKSASPNTPDAYQVGQEITYSFVVSNTGNVTLADITVTEGDFSGTGDMSAIECPDGAASLAPSAQVTCTATYVLTQEDVDAGEVTNSATATGTPPGDLEPPVSPPSETQVPVLPAPAISVVKSATPATMTSVGQVLTYSFVVTNTGNVTLGDVTVEDTDFSGEGELSMIACPVATESMLPGQTVTCTADYTTTQADVDAGLLTNTATATGTPPSGEPPVSPPSTVEVPFDGTDSLSIEKRATSVDVNHDGVVDLGDRVEWTIVVRNTGAQTISDIVVSDPTAGAVTCPSTALGSGAQMTCTVPAHTITAGDVRRGEVRNVATVTGDSPTGDPVDPPSSRATTAISPTPPPALAGTGGALSTGLLLGGLLLLFGAAVIPVARRRRLSQN
ncbi:DUF7507 domain-containing protein [Microbacterium oxydans]|uniref:DUF7507 domain-containing protein n=1 Tax=Microbacterium oxydans TaxID=82380 RepID=UPI00226B02FE|nr:GEVED domain-containing protein [Microbacterium oxydans]WAA66962.1 GEVED domain-containing protein [Microbacterium oxydans]